jgi:16S rRNA (cytosine967-C5)-methyltransferase
LTVRIDASVNPKKLYGFDEGLFFVQDVACAVSAEALGSTAGDRIVDVCACPGGKSFAAAILAGGDCEVHSFDLHESKLSLIEDGASRLRLDCIHVDALDATEPREELYDSCDKVICDVPCSGLGVLAKKPAIRHKDNKSLQNLPISQYDILEKSSLYLKAGGTIVYSTCTLNPDENERIVEKFLTNHPEFSYENFTVGNLTSAGGMLTMLPHVNESDGFFIAKLRKN